VACGQQHASCVSQSNDAVSICYTARCIVHAVYAVFPQTVRCDNLSAMDQRRSAIQCDHYMTTYPPITSNIDVNHQTSVCPHRCIDHRSSINQSSSIIMLIVQQPTMWHRSSNMHRSSIDAIQCYAVRCDTIQCGQCDTIQCDAIHRCVGHTHVHTRRASRHSVAASSSASSSNASSRSSSLISRAVSFTDRIPAIA
jgi:hypothetical protein